MHGFAMIDFHVHCYPAFLAKLGCGLSKRELLSGGRYAGHTAGMDEDTMWKKVFY